jgi:hypothetical protein
VRWQLGTATTQVEDLNQTYAALLTDGSVLRSANAFSANGRYIVGWGYNAATRRDEAFLLDTQGCASQNGDVDANGCVDDADLLAVLFNFGNTGSNSGTRRHQLRRVVDDADLLHCAVQLRQRLLRRAFAACGVGCNLSSAPTTWQSVGMRENSVPVTASLSADATRRAGRLTAPTHSLCAARSARRTACR